MIIGSMAVVKRHNKKSLWFFIQLITGLVKAGGMDKWRCF
jgi:hypothetical protein